MYNRLQVQVVPIRVLAVVELRDLLDRSAIRNDNNEHRYHSEDRSVAGAT